MLASTLSIVVIYGVLGVDFFCTLFLEVVGRDLSVFSLPDVRVVLSRCTTEEAIRDRHTPWNVLLLGCASPDR